MKNTKLDELRDIIALDKYGKLYTALPDDGAEQDYVAGEADRRMKLTCTPAVAAVEPVRGELAQDPYTPEQVLNNLKNIRGVARFSNVA
jgi:hypothetical protein